MPIDDSPRIPRVGPRNWRWRDWVGLGALGLAVFGANCKTGLAAGRGGRPASTDRSPAVPASVSVVADDGPGCTSCGTGACSDAGCTDLSCDSCQPACRFTSCWGNVEYLMLWERGQSLPALATTNVNPGSTNRDDAGVLGVDSTRVLFGDESVDEDRHGGRVTFGIWLDQCASVGIGFGYLGVGESTRNFETNSTVSPILARPFFNAIDSSEDALLIGFPNAFSGSFSAQLTSELNAVEAFKRQSCYRGCNSRIDILVGYRYSQMQDSLRIQDSFTFLADQAVAGGPPIPAGSTVSNLDFFDVDNTLHAGQLGAWAQRRSGNFSMDVIAKVALGNMNHDISTQGETVSAQPNVAAVTVPGGLLVQRSNLGTFEDNGFAVMPEVSTNLGYQINPYIDLTVGYTFMYWSRVVRPGDTIDRVVDLRQQGGNLPDVQQRPAIQFNDTSYWLQGLTFGMNFRY